LLLNRLGRVQVWRLTDPEPVLLQDELNNAWAFSPDSRRLVSAHPDGSLYLYDLPSGRQVKKLAIGVHATSLAFHPSAQQLALICAGGVQVRDLTSGSVLAELPQSPRAWRLAWHPDGKSLAVDDGDRVVHLWDVAARKQIARLEEHKGSGVSFAYNHVGDLLASTCWDGILRLWDPRTGLQLFNTQAVIGCFRFGLDDHRLAVGIDDDKLRLWEVAPAFGYRTFLRDPIQVRDGYYECAVSPKGRIVAAAMTDGVALWDLTSGRPLTLLPIRNATSILFEPSGALLTNGASLLRFPIQGDSAVPELLRIGKPQKLSLPGNNRAIASSGDGRLVAVAEPWGGLVGHPDLPELPIRLSSHEDVRHIDVSPDGRLVATGSHWGTKVKIWEARTGNPAGELPVESGSQVHFSPDGRWLATTGGGCRLWAVDSWKEGPQIGGMGPIAFTPDSKLLAVETGYGALRLVNPQTGEDYARLEDPNQGRPGSIAFSPDGTQLVTANNESHSVNVWDLRAIREELTKMGLDWELPAYPPLPEVTKPEPLQIQVELGGLAQLMGDRIQATRQIIEQKRRALDENPNSPVACNDLAWTYLNAPEALRGWKAALPLAQKAVQLDPSPMFRNTLGLAYYRNSRYREAVEALQANLKDQVDWALAYDLYFLAMSHHQLGDSAKARQFYDLAVRWSGAHQESLRPFVEELTAFHAEAAGLLGVKEKKD
jgi:WD40 repeat protein